MSGNPVMGLGQDRPTAALQDIMDEYGLCLTLRDRRRSGSPPWRIFLPPKGRPVYDSQATWTETHYRIRRKVLCEAYGQLFGYSFEVGQISRAHRSGRSTDGALQRKWPAVVAAALFPLLGGIERAPPERSVFCTMQ